MKCPAFWHVIFQLTTVPTRSAALLTFYFKDRFNFKNLRSHNVTIVASVKEFSISLFLTAEVGLIEMHLFTLPYAVGFDNASVVECSGFQSCLVPIHMAKTPTPLH